MVLGAVPLAISTGAGAESRQQIGWVIVGGMSLGTLLTIFVVPTMYTLFARGKVPGANKADAQAAATHAHPVHGHEAPAAPALAETAAPAAAPERELIAK
jgi:multidrug efflux pump